MLFRSLKRRGPPLAAPLQLALPPVLSAAAQGKAALARVALARVAGGAQSQLLRAAAFIDLS